MKLSQKSLSFIEVYVLPKLGIDIMSDDNLQEIVDYISNNYEIPLAQAKEAGEKIDENFLDLAASVVTEITTSPNW